MRASGGAAALAALLLAAGLHCGNDQSSLGDGSGGSGGGNVWSPGNTSSSSGAPACSGCDDGFACTIDTCDAAGCHHVIGPNVGATACAPAQYCELAQGCIASPACATVLDCEQALGGDACKSEIACDPATSVCTFALLDKDDDGHAPEVCGGDDCDDGDDERFAGNVESCNGKDDDCDGAVDDGACGAGGGSTSSSSSSSSSSSGSGPNACAQACAKIASCGLDMCAQSGIDCQAPDELPKACTDCILTADCGGIVGCQAPCTGQGQGGAGGAGGGGVSQDCTTCTMNNCANEAIGCFQETLCQAWMNCVGTCASSACIDGCTNEAGPSAAVVELLLCTCASCAADCPTGSGCAAP